MRRPVPALSPLGGLIGLLCLAAGTPGLAPRTVEEGALEAGESRVYTLEVVTGQFLSLLVEQIGIDARLALTAEDGRELEAVDRWAVGSEQLLWIAPEAGQLRVEVRGMEGPAGTPAAGSYRLHLDEQRPAEPGDDTLIAATNAYLDAIAHGREGTQEGTWKAIQRYREALELWRRLDGREAEAASTLNNLGTAYYSLSEPRQALGYFEEALEAWRSLGDRKSEASTLKAAATARFALGESSAAGELFAQALEIAERLEDRSLELGLLYNLGVVHRQKGESRQALARLQQAFDLMGARGETGREVPILNSLGLVYNDLGEPERALDLFERALAAADHPAERATTLVNLGAAATGLGDHGKALDYYSQSLELSRELGNRDRLAKTLNNLGWTLNRLGRPRDALDRYRESLALSSSAGFVQTEASALDNMGEAWAALGELDKALEYLDRALPLRRAVLDRSGEAGTLAAMAMVERRRGDLGAALGHLREALAVTESLRSNAPSQTLRSSFFASKREYYDLSVELLLELDRQRPGEGFGEQAFEAAERAKARSLLELLTEARIDIEADISPELKRSEREVAQRLNDLQGQLLELRSEREPDEGAVAGLQEAWREAERERERLEWRIRRDHPRYARLQYPQALGPAEIRRQLRADTALLEYSLGTESSALFVVTRGGLEIHRLPPAAEIAALVQEAREGLKRPGRREAGAYRAAAYALYRILVEPAARTLKAHRSLLVSPDRSLHLLAFESLLEEPPLATARLDPQRLPFLLKRWSVSYVPSATVLASLKARPSAPVTTEPAAPELTPLELVAFGDPVYESGEQVAEAGTTRSGLGLRGATHATAFARPPRLPESSREVSEIAGVFEPQEVRLFVRGEAREDEVKHSEAVRRARHLHFATHAVTSESQPQYSGLVLSLDQALGEDGLLQVYEIFQLRLEADLVTLSACETGLGKAVTGEGLVGLTQAFLYAGAPSLVVSLWQVADRSTADLMVRFYRNLDGEEASKAEALRQAKLALIEDGRYAHPFYWAPFVLVGRP